jgi:hypothetical protein
MFKLGVLVVALLSGPIAKQPTDEASYGLMCIKTGESVDGYYKVCWYNCAGSEVPIYIPVHQVCPVYITR